MTEAGELKTKAPYNKIVNNKYAEKVIKQKNAKRLRIKNNVSNQQALS